MTGTYMHGYALSEQERLRRLNELLNGSALRELRVEPGERVIDFGAGLGQLTRAIARAARRPVVAIELGVDQVCRGRHLDAGAMILGEWITPFASPRPPKTRFR